MRSLLAWLAAAGCAAAVAAEPPTAWTEALRTSQAAIGRPLAPADTLPLTDSLNRPLKLADFRGKPLVVSFVYTGCYQACPVATQGLARVVNTARETLGDGNFQVVTIGFNQPFDGPEAMAAFARQARITDPRWAFASARAADVPALTRAFGFSWTATPKGFDHIAQASIVDANGVVYRQVYGDTPELAQFVGPLKELLTGQAGAPPSVEDLWTKVVLYCTVYDPVSGGYRLNYSLFFELFCGLTFLGTLGWLLAREWRHRSGSPPVPSLRASRPAGGSGGPAKPDPLERVT